MNVNSNIGKDYVYDNRLRSEILQFLSIQGTRGTASSLLGGFLIPAVLYQHFELLWLVLWQLGYSFVVVLRWITLSRLPNMNHLSLRNRIAIADFINGLNGTLIGLTVLFFPYVGDYERALLSMFAIAAAGASVTGSNGFKYQFHSFLFPTLLPYAIGWTLLVPGGSGVTEYTIGFLLLVYCLILLQFGSIAASLYIELFENRLKLQTMNSKMSLALDKAEQANASKTRFLAAASHDLRQPIQAMNVFCATLERQELNDRSRTISLNIRKSVDAVSQQLDALLDISKLDANLVAVSKQVIELNRLFSDLEQQYQSIASTKSLEFKVAVDTAIFVETDIALFERIIRNLLDNAFKYTIEGTIELKVGHGDKEVVVQIKDSGIGIHEDQLEHIFEEFFQVDNPQRDRVNGLGLGLSIVTRLVKLLNMQITVTSTPKAGTQFTLHIPQTDLPIGHTPFEYIDHMPNVDLLINKKILIVDDEPDVLKSMQFYLEDIGMKTITASNKEDALTIARSTSPDIVLSDFRLQNHNNGIDLVHEIREFLPELPALIISGDTSPERLRVASVSGLELLHKPVKLHHLIAELNRLIESNRKSQPASV
ncbi:MAG: hybrid sensor histidine kinase/response regulator [Gammaproteobacteria bacterium]|nr:hybrid sensor histidine kinase/response regulator [Gammaproteobacteria bacterium]MDH5729290.1 hybrid sensor histidine kinase/response regulator [Gammaproteobacteria bacterium]